MDDTIVGRDGKSCSRGEDNERTGEAPDRVVMEAESVRASVVTTVAAAGSNERGEDHLARMEGPQCARSLTQERSQMNSSFMVSPWKKAKHKDEQQSRSQFGSIVTEAIGGYAAAHHQQQQQQVQKQQQRSLLQEQQVELGLTSSTTTKAGRLSPFIGKDDDRKPAAVGPKGGPLLDDAESLGLSEDPQGEDTNAAAVPAAGVSNDNHNDKDLSPLALSSHSDRNSGNDDDHDERLPVGAVILYREKKDDDWRTGTVVNHAIQFESDNNGNDNDNEKDIEDEFIGYEVQPIWSHETDDDSEPENFVEHSNSLLQRLSKNELEEHICSELDRLFASRDLEVTFFSGCLIGRLKISIKTGEGWYRVCNYRFTDAMLMRVGAWLRRNCCDLKDCQVSESFCNQFSRKALTAFVRGIAWACSPTVTRLGLHSMGEELFDSVLESLFSEKAHMIRELWLRSCTIPSLASLQRLSRSLRVIDFSYCTLHDRCWVNLDEFFKMQTAMEDPVLRCLKFHCLPRKALHLNDSFNADDASQLKQFLPATKVLQELYLNYSHLNDAACRTIAEGLAKSPSLQELTISLRSRGQVETIVSALAQQAEDNQQGLRVLRLKLWPSRTFLDEKAMFNFCWSNSNAY